MTENHLVSLIIRHWSGELSGEDAAELDQWASLQPENRALLERITSEELLEKELDSWQRLDPVGAYLKLEAQVSAGKRARIRRMIGWSVAAALLSAVVIVGIKFKNAGSHTIEPAPVVAKVAPPVMPGRNTATLTLGNGRQILLDSAANGELAVQGRQRVVKKDNGSLTYTAAGGKGSEEVAYNVLMTPRSGQYHLTLPDGSRVWLNNVSSLRYPTSFVGKNRTVELTGEAYFEIAKDATQPFIVKVKGQEVDVLGTSFNIMAYPDEGAIQTTLLTGSIRVKVGGSSANLRPDEQTQWNGPGSLTVVKNVSSQDIISWKNGFFYFGRASFASVMRQLARWYDVDIIYKGRVPDMEFGGKIDRSLPLKELLKFLDKNQIHFQIEGRNLIVLPS